MVTTSPNDVTHWQDKMKEMLQKQGIDTAGMSMGGGGLTPEMMAAMAKASGQQKPPPAPESETATDAGTEPPKAPDGDHIEL